MIVQYIKVLTSLWDFACFNASRGRKDTRKENARHCSDSSLGVCICCVIGRKSTASLRPQISTDDDTRRAWHTFIGVRTQSISKAATGNLSSAGPDLVDLVRPLMTFSHFSGLGGLLLLFASFCNCASPAYDYQASGPYCITDGVDRRERRQPTCFLERQGVCSWVREWKGKDSVRDGRIEQDRICLHVSDMETNRDMGSSWAEGNITTMINSVRTYRVQNIYPVLILHKGTLIMTNLCEVLE